jgi:hypothetical protein
MIPVAVTVMLAGPLTAAAPAVAAGKCGGTALEGQLYGVAATSASNAWAVGNYRGKIAARTLTERWNGTQWCRVPSPDPSSHGDPNGLQAVAATSATNAWAVGHYGVAGVGVLTLILHWNGTAWTQVPSPNPSGSFGYNALMGVTATSAGDAWAVGQYATEAGRFSLILHWNGTAWTQVPSPTPGIGVTLTGVSASSASNAWVSGWFSSPVETLTEHWNGTAWNYAKSPNPQSGTGHTSSLDSVATTSAGNAWAVGRESNTRSGQDLVLHRNGTRWHVMTVPQPGTSSNLSAVTATSAANVWAVGAFIKGNASDTLVLHWNGAAWTRAASPSPGGSVPLDQLFAVSATSANNAWAVGAYDNGPTGGTVILHWDGTAWTLVPSP